MGKVFFIHCPHFYSPSMTKSKKRKTKKKKASPKKSIRTKAKVKKAGSTKKKAMKSKAKIKVNKVHKKSVPKKSKLVKEKKITKKEIKEAKEKNKHALPTHEISAEKSHALPVHKPMNPKALAKAKEAILEKERQKNVALSFDKAAYEKQMKLAEPKNKLVLEYIIHSSQALLYEFISSPSGLSEWFADDVNIVGSVYSFFWEGAKQEAKVLNVKENKSIRFQWTDRAPNTYFELRIEKNELTEELSLIITDFAEGAEEKNSLEVLWQGQVQQLMKVLGSKF